MTSRAKNIAQALMPALNIFGGWEKTVAGISSG